MLYMVTWIPSIYPLYVSIYTIHGSYGVCKQEYDIIIDRAFRQSETWGYHPHLTGNTFKAFGDFKGLLGRSQLQLSGSLPPAE